MRPVSKHLVVGPFFGELGYEIGNWLPYVAVHADNESWDSIDVFCQTGHGALYPGVVPTATIHDCPFSCATRCQEGNFLAEHPPREAVAQYESARQAALLRAAALRQNRTAFPQVMHLSCGADDHHTLYAPQAPVFMRVPNSSIADEALGPGGKPVIICYRGYERGASKNTRPDILSELPGKLQRLGFRPIVVGRTASKPPTVAPGVLNLVNQTTIGDLIALYSGAACVVGASSGTLHLAAVCGTPHVTWGGDNWGEITRLRYERLWNLPRTPVRFLDTPGYAWEMDVDRVACAVAEMARPLALSDDAATTDYRLLRMSKYAERDDLPSWSAPDPIGDDILASLPHWRDKWMLGEHSGRRWQYTWAAVNAQDSPGSVLDAGADDVSLQFYFAQRGAQVTSLDLDAAALDRARRAAEALGLADKMRFMQHNLCDHLGEQYDLVLCLSVLEHIPNWHHAAKHLAHAVAPGGRLLLTVDVRTPGATLPYFTPKDIVQLVRRVEKHGCRLVGDGAQLAALPPQPLVQMCGQKRDQPLTWAGLLFERPKE